MGIINRQSLSDVDYHKFLLRLLLIAHQVIPRYFFYNFALYVLSCVIILVITYIIITGLQECFIQKLRTEMTVYLKPKNCKLFTVLYILHVLYIFVREKMGFRLNSTSLYENILIVINLSIKQSDFSTRFFPWYFLIKSQHQPTQITKIKLNFVGDKICSEKYLKWYIMINLSRHQKLILNFVALIHSKYSLFGVYNRVIYSLRSASRKEARHADSH
jgi:hypothetical protein